MKRMLWLTWLGFILGTAASVLADGFIIVEPPFPIPRPVPPPDQPWRIRPTHYSFAPLEVTYHHVNVRINDQVAVTAVDQEFYNPNDRQLEGTYIFPIPKGAQINKFTMDIGGKEVEAELLAADKARRIYEDIVRKMKDPALLEYVGRDVFKVRIFPIEPRSKKRIKLSYTQVLKADSGLVNYVYPLNTEKFSAKPIQNVSLKLELETPRPLKSIYSPSHTVEIRRHGESKATVGFESKDIKPDTDFQLFYATDMSDLGVNVMAYKTGAEDGYFLLLAAPAFETKQSKVVLKDVAFVLDTSGSMAGKKLEQAKKALQFCVDNLNDGDRFELIRFSTETEPLFNKLAEATAKNRDRAHDFIKDLKATGGTDIDGALNQALKMRPATSERPYIIIFLTDGRPTVGETDENRIVDQVTKKQAKKDEEEGRSSTGSEHTRIFCFGIGNDVNTHLLDKITEATHAYSQYVLPDEDLEVKLSSFYEKIKAPVLTDLQLTFPANVHPTKMYPSPLPDLFKGEQLIVAGRYSHEGDGKLVIKGSANGKEKRFSYDCSFPEQAHEYDFIPRLWATRRIGYLLEAIRLHGEDKELREEVTELARKYSVVTPYTSYLIMEDERQRNVPLVTRSLSSLDQNAIARQQAGQAYYDMKDKKVGAEATSIARYGLAMRSATATPEALAQNNQELMRRYNYAAPTAPASAASGIGGIAGAGRARGTISQSVTIAGKPETTIVAEPQTRFVGGRSFYRNGNQWIDAQVQKKPNAKHVKILFNSDDYFNLIAKEPQVLPWVALGANVQFVLGEAVYEIHE